MGRHQSQVAALVPGKKQNNIGIYNPGQVSPPSGDVSPLKSSKLLGQKNLITEAFSSVTKMTTVTKTALE